METILLSINPEFVEKIFDGTKKYEFRKRLADKSVNRILVYATVPTKQVVGEVRVLDTLAASPSALWETTKKNAGISREKFREYFKGCKVAYAYCLGEIIKYEQPKSLDDFGISNPPQSFIYLSDNM